MKIKRKDFCSTNYAYLPSALEQLNEFVDKLKKEDVITIYETKTKTGYYYTLLYWDDKKEE